MSTPTVTRPITVLIAALGGEGGGVLTNWIVSAAQKSGFPVQATSIPGVAQRTGATTYYVEVWPQAESELDGRRPILALAPAQGEVDLVIATELLEAGRTIMNGFVTPDRTHLISSTHRVLTTSEKLSLDDGRHDSSAVITAANSRSKSCLLSDMGSLAANAGSIINAVMLGALAGANVLPIETEAFQDAIRDSRKAVDANLRGFQAGMEAASTPPSDANASIDDVDSIAAAGIARLGAYQDAAYANLYVERLAAFSDAAPGLQAAIAKNLAVRMSYDDIIRVAGEKVRKAPAAAPKGGVVHVTQYLKPGINEVCDMLPPWAAKRLLRKAAHDSWWADKQWPMSLRTTTVFGFFRLWALSKLKPFRRGTYRFGVEQYAIDAWLDDVRRAAVIDGEFAIAVADMARLIKGYGKTHQRGTQNFNRVRDGVLIPALNGTLEDSMAAETLRSAVATALSSEDGKDLDAELRKLRNTLAADAAE